MSDINEFTFRKADKEDDSKAYATFKNLMHRHFPFLDPKVPDAARYFDGADNPNAVFYPGTLTINKVYPASLRSFPSKPSLP